MKTFYCLAIIGIALLGSVSAASSIDLSSLIDLSCLKLDECLKQLEDALGLVLDDIGRSPVRSSEDSFAKNSKSSLLSTRANECDQCSNLNKIGDIIERICQTNTTNETVVNAVNCILKQLDCVIDQLVEELNIPLLKDLLTCLSEIVSPVYSSLLSCDDAKSLVNFIEKLLNGTLDKDSLSDTLNNLLNSINLNCLNDILKNSLGDLTNQLCGLGDLSDILTTILGIFGLLGFGR